MQGEVFFFFLLIRFLVGSLEGRKVLDRNPRQGCG